MGQDNGPSALQYAGDIRDSDRDIMMSADHGTRGRGDNVTMMNVGILQAFQLLR